MIRSQGRNRLNPNTHESDRKEREERIKYVQVVTVAAFMLQFVGVCITEYFLNTMHKDKNQTYNAVQLIRILLQSRSLIHPRVIHLLSKQVHTSVHVMLSSIAALYKTGKFICDH